MTIQAECQFSSFSLPSHSWSELSSSSSTYFLPLSSSYYHGRFSTIWALPLFIFLIHTHKKISAYMLTAHLHAHPHSSSMPSGHLQGGHNPSEWWECWAGTYQRCQYDQQHLYPPHIHTRAHTLTHGYLSVCMWVATGVYKCAETALACVFCMHAVVINFCWRGEKPVFSASLCAALWCIVFVYLRDCSSMLRLCKICMSHMCSALWTCRRVFGRCFCSVCMQI